MMNKLFIISILGFLLSTVSYQLTASPSDRPEQTTPDNALTEAQNTRSTASGLEATENKSARELAEAYPEDSFDCPSLERFTCGLTYCFWYKEVLNKEVLHFGFRPCDGYYNFPYRTYSKPNAPENDLCTDPSKLNQGYDIDALEGLIFHGVVQVKPLNSNTFLTIPFKTSKLKRKFLTRNDGTGATTAKYKFYIYEDTEKNTSLYKPYGYQKGISRWRDFKQALVRQQLETDQSVEKVLDGTRITMTLVSSPKYSHQSYIGSLRARLKLNMIPALRNQLKIKYSSMFDFRFGAKEFRRDVHYIDSTSFLPKEGTYEIGDGEYEEYYGNGMYRPVEIVIIPGPIKN